MSHTLLALVGAGDRIISHRCVYDWADTFWHEEAPRFGIEALQMDLRDLDGLRAALRTRTRLVYFEPVSNSSMDVIDVRAVCKLAHEAGALVVADNTFLSPYLFQPLACGVDVVVHSATKYLNGHGDALAGVITTNDDDIAAKVRRARRIYGGVISPMNAFLVMRGIQTLPLRMDRHCANAMAVAEHLAQHPQVREVRYPGLPSHPDHAVARAQFRGYGGMLCFQLKGGADAAERFVEGTHICRPWVSLGDTKTLVHARKPEDRRGVPEGYVRVSVGLEELSDILADMDAALGAL